jgi:Carbohydrate esterase, sialic acid-specific acetylesterase
LFVSVVGIAGIALAVVLAFIFVQRLRRSLRALHQHLGETKAAVSALQHHLAERDTLSIPHRELIETKNGVSALQTEVGEVQNRLAVLNHFAERNRHFQNSLKNELAALHFALGRPSQPFDIVIGDSDSYERLDQNWGSIHDSAGRQPSPAVIDGARIRTAVIISLGQSNAGNHGSGRYFAKQRVDNFNLYDSGCYHAEDPLLGASGDGGNFATRLGDKLVAAGLFDRVILAPIAMGGTTVEQWAHEGMFNRRIIVLIRRLYDAGLSADFILWHQGEGNPGIGDVDGRQYRKNLWEVVSTFRRYGVDAPFFVSLATLCGGPHPNAENIRAGQKGAVDAKSRIYLGPDTDTIGVEHRWDGCHFNEVGLDMASTLWLEVIADFESKLGAEPAGRTLMPAHKGAERQS